MIVIGIGGSYLSIEFVYEALRWHQEAITLAKGRQIRFLANIDPIDFRRSIDDLDPEETLILINSKTFTTAETMLNARSVRNWLFSAYESKGENLSSAKIQAEIAGKHIIACSTEKKLTKDFGIKEENIFEFWDWVGGRFSVCSAIGVLPLSIIFGFEFVEKFLKGCHSVDKMFREEK